MLTRLLARLAVGLAFVAAAGLGAGCPSDSPEPPAPAGQAELGTGMVAFEPLADGDPLDLIAGPQGGFHFIVHARMRGLSPGDPRQPGAPGNPTTYIRAVDENGARVDLPEVRQLGYVRQDQAGGDPGDGDAGQSPGNPDPDAWHALPSGRIVLIDNLRVAELYGRPVTLELVIEDIDGRTATAAVTIVAIEVPLENPVSP